MAGPGSRSLGGSCFSSFARGTSGSYRRSVTVFLTQREKRMGDFTLVQLRYFVVAAELSSMTTAARELLVAQSASGDPPAHRRRLASRKMVQEYRLDWASRSYRLAGTPLGGLVLGGPIRTP